MDQEHNGQFIEEADKVKYVRDVGEGRTVEVYLTKDYLAKTETRIIENYLNNAVEAIVNRETRDV